jgi:hypothetical protein
MWDKILKTFGLHQNKHGYGRRYGKKYGLLEMCGVLRVTMNYTNASQPSKPLSRRYRQIYNSVLLLLINFVSHTVLNNRIIIHDKLEQASKEAGSNS